MSADERAIERATHVAASDCERCRPGLVAQPVNTASSLAFIVAGVAVLREGDRPAAGRAAPSTAERAVGWAAIAAGVGSVAYHGPGTPAGRLAHDAGLLALLATTTTANLEAATGRTAPPSVVAATTTLTAALALDRRTSMAAQGALGVALVASEVLRQRQRTGSGPRRALQAAIGAVGATAHLLGRSGGPWCRPGSVAQPHALWHGAMAATVVLRHRDQHPAAQAPADRARVSRVPDSAAAGPVPRAGTVGGATTGGAAADDETERRADATDHPAGGAR